MSHLDGVEFKVLIRGRHLERNLLYSIEDYSIIHWYLSLSS